MKKKGKMIMNNAGLTTKAISCLIIIALLLPFIPLKSFAVIDSGIDGNEEKINDITDCVNDGEISESENKNEGRNPDKDSDKELFKIIPAIVKEDATKREEYCKQFVCDDGSVIAVAYSDRVHKSDKNGKWVDIYCPEGEEISFSNENYTIYFTAEAVFDNDSSNSSIKINEFEKRVLENDYHVSDSIDNITKAKKTINETIIKHFLDFLIKPTNDDFDQKSENVDEIIASIEQLNERVSSYNNSIIKNVVSGSTVIEYENAFGRDTMMQYVKSSNGIKENLILNNPVEFNNYTSVLTVGKLKGVLFEDNHVELVDDSNETVFCVSSPLMYDSEGNFSTDFDVIIQQNDDVLNITYIPDKEWLNDSGRCYPITIDPTFSRSFDSSNFEQTFVSSNNPATSFCNYSFMCVSKQTDYNAFGTAYSYFWFKNLPSISGNYVNDSSVQLTVYQSGSNVLIDVGIPDELWHFSTMTYYNRPDLNLFLHENKEIIGTTFTIDTGCLPVNWYSTVEARSVGLGLSISSSSSDGYALFYNARAASVANRPYIVLYCSAKPSPSTVTHAVINDGIYYVSNCYLTDKYLTLNTSTYNIELNNLQPGAGQRWFISQNSDGSYSFTPIIKFDYKMEVHCGNYIPYRPITAYDYTGNTTSSHIRFYLNANSDGSYSFRPVNYNQFAIGCFSGNYLGEDTTMFFYNSYKQTYREFEKIAGQSIQLDYYDGSAYQHWRFTTSGIYLESSGDTLKLGESIDLDDVVVYPSVYQRNWSVQSGGGLGTYYSTHKIFTANSPGTVVFRVTIFNMTADYSVNIVNESLFEEGLYYIKNMGNGLRMGCSDDEDGVEVKTYGFGSPLINDSGLLWDIKKLIDNNYSFRRPNWINAMNIKSNITGDICLSNIQYDRLLFIKTDDIECYNIVPYNNMEKAFDVETNGTKVVLASKNWTKNSQKWIIENPLYCKDSYYEIVTSNNNYSIAFNKTYDFRCFKITLPANSDYLLIKVDAPKLLDDYCCTLVTIVSDNNDSMVLESASKTSLVKKVYCAVNAKPTCETTYYIRVSLLKYHDTPEENLDGITDCLVTVSTTIKQYGSELLGWNYRGNGPCAVTVNYTYDSTMNNEWKNGVTYADLFEEAMDMWNCLDIKGDSTALFGSISNGGYTVKVDNTLNGSYYTTVSATAINSEGDIYMIDFSSYGSEDRYHIVNTLAHELGHSLGLGDLYLINDSYEKQYGLTVNNINSLMCGYGRNNTTTISSSLVDGVGEIYGWEN